MSNCVGAVFSDQPAQPPPVSPQPQEAQAIIQAIPHQLRPLRFGPGQQVQAGGQQRDDDIGGLRRFSLRVQPGRAAVLLGQKGLRPR